MLILFISSFLLYGQVDTLPDQIIIDYIESHVTEEGDFFGEDEWSDGIPLGPEVNTIDGTQGSTITPDEKYLFFSARHGDKRGRYWISTEVIRKLAPENL